MLECWNTGIMDFGILEKAGLMANLSRRKSKMDNNL
jgi:hypothetical protein